MSHRRPEVFVSAASADLRSCRQLVKEGLLTLGCVPVEQTNFPPDFRRVRDMLRSKITGCDAVIHLAGECYGSEPSGRDGSGPRRSYTQLEYDLARELCKPLYVFLCDPAFAYDWHPPEDAEKHRLQQAHRAALSASDNLRCEVGSHADLALRVRELQTSVEHLTEELKKTRLWLSRGVTAGLVLLVGLGGGLWWLNQRTGKTETKVKSLETEFDRQRRYVAAVIEAYRQQQAEFEKLQLSESERLDQVLSTVAKREKQTEAAVWSAVSSYIASVRANRKADSMDTALADIVQRNILRPSASARKVDEIVTEKPRAPESIPIQSPPAWSPPLPAGTQGGPAGALPPIPVAQSDAMPLMSVPRAVPAPDDLADLRNRMTKRLPAINALKDRFAVGESNRGYLEVRGSITRDEEKTVAEENIDRSNVYAAIAAQTGVGAERVGQQRATQIANAEKSGRWIQHPSGEWRRKI